MGEKGVQILKIDSQELIAMLNAALSEEWLAYYQYWIGAKVMEGPMRGDIEKELVVHATQELAHAELVAARIIQLDGVPVLTPADWMALSSCPYEEPKDPYIEEVLRQNLNGERCAIQRYEGLASFTNGKDHVTHQMATTILNEELEHEQEIEDWLKDINRMKEDLKKLRT